jgi:ribosomal protein S18 acetylase RimI-like enzyme
VSVELAAARVLDAGAVGSILSDSIEELDWMPRLHTRAEDISFAAEMIDQGWVTVARKQNTLCGFLALRGGEVLSLYVDAKARSQGVGQTLWTFAANERAQRFYARAGFVEMERGDGSGNDEGLPDIRFEWKRIR